MTTRRGFITGLISFAVTAPAIVRATSLMPVKVMEPYNFVEEIAFTSSEWPINEASVMTLKDMDAFLHRLAAYREHYLTRR